MELSKYKRLWSRNYSVQYCESVLNSISQGGPNKLFEQAKDIFFIPENKNQTLFVNEKEWNLVDKSLFDNYKKMSQMR